MKAKTFVYMSLVGILLLVVPYLAFSRIGTVHPATGEPLEAQAFRASGAVSIDASLEEWDGVVPAEINTVEQINVRPELWDGTDDASVQVFCMWDDDTIYIAAVATDDIPTFDQIEANIWQQDCIEMFFGPENAEAQPEGWPHETHYQFGLAPGGPADDPQKYTWCDPDGNANHVPDYVEIASDVSDPYDGYVIEASISLDGTTILAEKVAEGNVIGYHISMDDADGQGNSPDCHITWSGGEPHDDGFFGNLTFVGAATTVSPQGKMATTWGILKAEY